MRARLLKRPPRANVTPTVWTRVTGAETATSDANGGVYKVSPHVCVSLVNPEDTKAHEMLRRSLTVTCLFPAWFSLRLTNVGLSDNRPVILSADHFRHAEVML